MLVPTSASEQISVKDELIFLAKSKMLAAESLIYTSKKSEKVFIIIMYNKITVM